MLRWMMCFAIAGCAASVDMPPVLRVEPPAIAFTIAPGEQAGVTLHAYVGAGDEREVTAEASFAFAGTALGAIAGNRFTSDGATAGSATLAVTYDGLVATVPVEVDLRGRRLVDGVPASAPDAFAAATQLTRAAALDPGDGAILPPDLDRLEVKYPAGGAGSLERLVITAPHLHLEIYAPGAAGQVSLTSAEWRAISSTARGVPFALDAASLEAGATSSHVSTAQLAVADLDLDTVLFGGRLGATDDPTLWRYEPITASVQPFAIAGHTCVGCHIAASPDGTRIAAGALVPGTAEGATGFIADALQGTVMAEADAGAPWLTGSFDPSGRLVTAWEGALTLRDGATGAPLAPVATGEPASAPTISADGKLAYVTLDQGGEASSFPLGNALHVRPWDPAAGTVGAPLELARDPGGTGVLLPQFSPDGAWIAYTRTSSALSGVPRSAVAVRADGTGTPVELVPPSSAPATQAANGLARWASPIAMARAGGIAPERMAWVVFVAPYPADNPNLGGQLWLEAFFPDRGVVSPPFHLPGQPGSLEVLHAPTAIATR